MFNNYGSGLYGNGQPHALRPTRMTAVVFRAGQRERAPMYGYMYVYVCMLAKESDTCGEQQRRGGPVEQSTWGGVVDTAR